MRLFHLIRYFKDSLLFSGGFGVFMGFVVTNVFISLHEGEEIIMSLGDIEADTSSSDVSSKVATTNTGTDRLNGNKRIKIFCMVLSSLDYDGEKAKIVNNTWGKRCDTLIFFTSHKADNLNTILLPKNINDSRGTLWEKVKFGFSHAYSSYYDDFDWFLKADDDTYVVMENLKMFLSGYNTSDAMFFGCRLTRELVYLNLFRMDAKPTGYMSGGAGYVLSKEALRRFVERALSHRTCYAGLTWAEDINMGKCLEMVDVEFMDTRDYLGRLRFFPLMPYDQGFLRPGRLRHDFWYYSSMYYHTNDGKDCCAESAITFHYASSYMDMIEFFLYHLSPYQN